LRQCGAIARFASHFRWLGGSRPPGETAATLAAEALASVQLKGSIRWAGISFSDTTVAILDGSQSDRSAVPDKIVLKIATSAAGMASLASASAGVRGILGDARLSDEHSIVPKPLGEYRGAGGLVSVERMIVGEDGRAVLATGADRPRTLQSSTAAISSFHQH